MAPVMRVLQTRGLPILYMLRIEEALLRATSDNWIFVNDGTKEPAIVLGISGKPHELVHVEAAHKARIPLIKRFSGGGTVIVDSNTVFSTLIASTKDVPDVDPFPRPIMEFAAEVRSGSTTVAYSVLRGQIATTRACIHTSQASKHCM
jgi:lipoate-protein ligase A